jgi:hypothetical protein
MTKFETLLTHGYTLCNHVIMVLKVFNRMHSSPVMQNLYANLCHLTERADLFTALPPGEIPVAVEVNISSVCACRYFCVTLYNYNVAACFDQIQLT